MKRWRWLWLLIALPVIAGFARLRFDAEIFNLLPSGLPSVQGLQLQQRYFSGARELLITVQGADAETTTTAAQAIAAQLSARTNLARQVRWQPPWLEDPAAAAENVAWLWLQQPPEVFSALVARLAPAQLPAQLAATRETLATSLDPQELARTSYDPLGLTRLPVAGNTAMRFDDGGGIFASEDGRFRLVFVEPPRENLNYRQLATWLKEVKAAVAPVLAGLPGSPIVKVSYTGGPAFLAEIATGMESDMQSSVLSTLLIIAGLFWLAHRSWRPLFCLLLGLLLTLVLTLALGGLVFGTLNVVSVGFAAVLLGLTVDYGLVSYQGFVCEPDKSVAEIRHEVLPGIGYSAATTAGTFLLLGLAGLPGLAQLGALTAMGLTVGALVMLYVFLPLVMRRPPAKPLPQHPPRFLRPSWWPAALVVGGIVAVLAIRGVPEVTSSADPLRPRHSEAYAAMDELKVRLNRTQEPTWAIFVGTNTLAVARDLERSETALKAAQTRGEISSYNLPSGFWPRDDFSRTNRVTAATLAQRADELTATAVAAGFTADSMGLARTVLNYWGTLTEATATSWPTNATARWIAAQTSARDSQGHWLALGLIQPATPAVPAHLPLATALPSNVLLTSWETLGPALLEHVAVRVTWLTASIALVLAGCLWLAFRRWQEVVLGFVALGFSFALLVAVMSLLGWSWNLLSLVALPLLLGSSVDSTIHVQLALRKDGADLSKLWRTTGKALLLCAGANIAGFGSLAWSNNAGLASMDLVCAVGVACVFTVCLGLLPGLWCVLGGSPVTSHETPPPSGPSALYHGTLWRAGLWLARWLPAAVAHGIARPLTSLYASFRPNRLAVVQENLRPVVTDETKLPEVARRNFREFAAKLVDLWRHEAGSFDTESVQPGQGWEHFIAALESGRGVLLVTPHLGNWELGSILLSRKGIRPLVLTAPEPAGGLTEVRRAARARQGIDTLVVGDDPFAFVEVIRRLQAGGMVAVLLDRPAPATQVTVELFGRALPASNAAAELARASGCLVLPVCILREAGGYRAQTLPPVPYDRATLGSREGRVEFTGRILRALEPVIRQYPEQWFHFVPIWR